MTATVLLEKNQSVQRIGNGHGGICRFIHKEFVKYSHGIEEGGKL